MRTILLVSAFISMAIAVACTVGGKYDQAAAYYGSACFSLLIEARIARAGK